MATDYQQFFPAWAQAAVLPARSEWIRWRDLQVHLLRCGPKDAPVKVVALHGAGGHGELMLPIASLAGWVEVIAPDLPGYGLTRYPGCRVDYSTWVDLAAELIAGERERDSRPVLVIGASVGGMLAYSGVARVGTDALAVTCLLDMQREEVRQAVARFSFLGAVEPRALSIVRPLDGVSVPVRWFARMSAMSANAELNEAVAADRSGGGAWVSLRLLRTLFVSAPEVEPEQFTICPVLLAHPGSDEWTAPSLSTPFYERLPGPKEFVLLEGCSHLPVEEPGITQLAGALRRLAESLH